MPRNEDEAETESSSAQRRHYGATCSQYPFYMGYIIFYVSDR